MRRHHFRLANYRFVIENFTDEQIIRNAQDCSPAASFLLDSIDQAENAQPYAALQQEWLSRHPRKKPK